MKEWQINDTSGGKYGLCDPTEDPGPQGPRGLQGSRGLHGESGLPGTRSELGSVLYA